nr:unnamed protein product [Callosobruchus analis]
MWRAYNALSDFGYVHYRVNHSDPEHCFVAPDGTNTQRIEATWTPAKDWFRSHHVPTDNFADTLCEYLWRRHCKCRGIDPFTFLLEAIRAQYKI